MERFEGIEAVKQAVGRAFTADSWTEMPHQAMQRFSEATAASVDAAKPTDTISSPFGEELVPGELLLAFGRTLSRAVYAFDGFAWAMDYGFERVRFTTAVGANRRFRLKARVESVKSHAGYLEVVVTETLLASSSDKEEGDVAYVADRVIRLYSAYAGGAF